MTKTKAVAKAELPIDEVEDVLIGVCELSVFFISQLRDGVQLGDFEAFFKKFTNDPAFKAKMVEAYENYKLVPEQVKDISWLEGAKLGGVLISYVPQFIAAFKK